MENNKNKKLHKFSSPPTTGKNNKNTGVKLQKSRHLERDYTEKSYLSIRIVLESVLEKISI